MSWKAVLMNGPTIFTIICKWFCSSSRDLHQYHVMISHIYIYEIVPRSWNLMLNCLDHCMMLHLFYTCTHICIGISQNGWCSKIPERVLVWICSIIPHFDKYPYEFTSIMQTDLGRLYTFVNLFSRLEIKKILACRGTASWIITSLCCIWIHKFNFEFRSWS